MADQFRYRIKCPHPGPVALLLAGLLLAGCAAMGERGRDGPDTQLRPGESAIAPETRSADTGIRLGGDADDVDPEGQFDETEFYPGTGVFVDESATRPRARPPGEDGEITLNFEGQGIQEVVQAILGHMFEENYIIAPGVSGEVTFATARPIKRDQVMPVLEMLLRWNGATLIWREGAYHVVPISQAVAGNLVPRFDSASHARGYEVLAVPLEFISAAKMAELLEPWAKEDAVFSADNARNLLFLAGTRFELRNYLQIIETFDVDWLEGMSMGIFSLKRIEVAELLPELEGVFGEEGETPLAGMFRFMPLERLNALIVITPNEHYLNEAEKWIKRLDRSSATGGAQLYVYKVKNLEADVLAGYLGDLFGTGGAPRRPRESRSALAPGLERATATSVSEFQRSRAGGDSQSESRPRSTGGMQLGEEGSVRVTAVMETNSLLIQASPSEYESILAAIERLDEEPLQVMIEAQVLIVNLNDQLEYGVSWFLAHGSPEDSVPAFPEDQFAPSRDANAAQFGAGTNFLGTITRRAVGRNFVAATIEALESVSDLRTISSPSLMVRNNSDASINVGEQVPVESTTFIGGSSDGSRFGSVQYLNTGVILKVTPRVNPGGLVYLKLRQEVSTPGKPAREGGNPPVDTRTIETEVAVQSGQTIMLGGLIQEDTTDSKSGVPGLQRVPLLGGLFRKTTQSIKRTETLVMITPTVVESTDQLKRVSDEVRSQFEALRPLRGMQQPDPDPGADD